MVLKLRSGFPRQLSVIKENRRCSILFHLLVPGGRWQTVMGIRNSFASLCSSIFHRRRRWPLLPPPSAEIISRLAFGNGVFSLPQHPQRNAWAAETAGVATLAAPIPPLFSGGSTITQRGGPS